MTSITPLTVADFVAFQELQKGEPEIFASETALLRPLSWAHVLTDPGTISLLDGGEVVLTTGSGWPTDDSALTEVANELVAAGVSAIVIELGQTFLSAPGAVLKVCQKNDIAVIVLHSVIRFVQVTQQLHRAVLEAQNLALQARDDVHRMLTDLGLNRSPVDYIIEHLAKTLDAPVVLEDLAGNVIAWATPQLVGEAETTLALWADVRSRSELRLLSTRGVIERIAVEARGTKWGYLTALSGPEHPAGRRTVLELGAFALALGRLSDPSGDDWVRLSSKKLVDDLLKGRYRSDTDLQTQLNAVGLAVAGRELLALTLSGIGNFGSHPTLEHATLETALRRAVAPDGHTIIADSPEEFRLNAESPGAVNLLAIISLPELDPRAQQSADSVPPLATRLDRELEMLVPHSATKDWRAHLSLGVSSTGVTGLIASMEGVLETGFIETPAVTSRVSVQLAAAQPLSYLLRNFMGSGALQAFVRENIGPLVDYDAETGPGFHGDLLQVLSSYLEHPTNRSLAAKKANLSRSVFYQRLELIEDILGLNLSHGSVIARLQVALTAHRL